MSSSKKKQLRNAQNMTERQLAAEKEAKQLKRYTLTFWVVIALVLAIFVSAVALNPIKNIIYKNSDAIEVGGHTLSAVEANYFYIDAVNSYVNQVGDYISLFLNTSKPLDEQVYDKESGKTWADSFLDNAKSNIQYTYALYNEAVKNNFQLSEDQQKSIDSMMSTLKIYSSIYGYKNVDAYLRAVYGNGATEESYRNYYTVCATADAYHAEYAESLEYEASDLREFEAGSAFKYNSYSYAAYYLTVSSFYEGGTKGEDGKVTYSAEEKEAGRLAAEKVANELAAGTYATLEEFDAAIKALEINKENEKAASTKYEDVLYNGFNGTTGVSSLFQDWIAGKVESEVEGEDPAYVERKEGDMTVVANKSGSGDSEVVYGYYVLRFGSVSDNNYALKNVRHILISFEGGTKDSNGNVTYSDAEKDAAKLKASNLLKTWISGDKTEESFAELAEKNSTDTGSKSNGGLYEDIYPNQMVEAFNDWCFDSERKPGDTGLVETEYGYHVMYFVGDSETLFRDYMVEAALRSSDVSEWLTALEDAITVEVLSTKHIKMDLTLSH